MPKIHKIANQFCFECPGCGYYHGFTEGVWTFNGDFDKPTFSPSLLVNRHSPDARCHSFVKAGRIEFLADSFHALAGQTVELPEWSD